MVMIEYISAVVIVLYFKKEMVAKYASRFLSNTKYQNILKLL